MTDEATLSAHDLEMANTARAARGEGPLGPDGKPVEAAPEGTPEGTPEVPQRPEGVPAKFWNPETGEVNTDALIQSYNELERKQSQGGQEETPEGDDGDAVTPEGEATPTASEFISNAAGEYAETGKISEDTIKSLVDSGISEDTINQYMAGMEAQAKLHLMSAHEAAGGKDTFENAVKWAQVNMEPATYEALNIQFQNPATMDLAVKTLVSQFNQAEGTKGRRLEGAPFSSAGDVFRSQTEVVNAMSNPKYKNDPAYRKEVTEKLHRSRKSGLI